jgi:DNA-binding transcriptional MerR regulator
MMIPSDPITTDAMTISQLAQRAGVPVRRVRYYVSEGLLAAPVGRGRASYYTRAHLDRLQQILALREVNLSLEEIRDRLGDPEGTGMNDTQDDQSSEAWQRWHVYPGVEVHANGDLDQQVLETIETMVGAMRQAIEQERDSTDRMSGRNE